MWTVGRGGETANSSEMGVGRSLRGGQKGSRARGAADQREKAGGKERRDFRLEGDLRVSP